ncbi:MAG: G8 domain-containing protein, partial [Myxococcota bacterium]
MKRLTVLSISLFVGCAGCGRSGVEDLSPSRPEAPSARIETPADGVGEESAEVGSDRDAPAGGEEEHENHGNAGNPTAMLPLPTSMGRDSYCAMPHDGHSPNSTHHHPDDPDKRSEHQAAMALLLQDQATHVAIECGAWSNPETWEGGRIPDTDADVYIPLGVGVTYDLSAGPQLHYVMVEGFLEFATDRDTEIVLDSLIGAPSSHVHIGTPDEPVGAQYTARVEIADNGPIDTSRDPEELSRGLVLHGSVFIRGTSRTPHVELSNTPGSGTT